MIRQLLLLVLFTFLVVHGEAPPDRAWEAVLLSVQKSEIVASDDDPSDVSEGPTDKPAWMFKDFDESPAPQLNDSPSEYVSKDPMKLVDPVTVRFLGALLKNQSVSAIKFLRRGAQLDVANIYDASTVLHVAAARGNTAIAKALLGKGVDPNAMSDRFGTPLQAAIAGNSLPICKMLLTTGADINLRSTGGWSALHFAVFYGRRAILEWLLSVGTVDVNGYDLLWLTPVSQAAIVDRPDLIRMLIDAGADPSLCESPVNCGIHEAARLGHVDSLMELITTGVDVNYAPRTDFPTPLHVAIHFGELKVVEKLLATPGIDLRKVNSEGQSPLESSANACAGLRPEERDNRVCEIIYSVVKRALDKKKNRKRLN